MVLTNRGTVRKHEKKPEGDDESEERDGGGGEPDAEDEHDWDTLRKI